NKLEGLHMTRLEKCCIEMGITPNRITASRLVLAPVALFFQQLGGGWLGFCLLAIICAEVSDAIDGYLARRWKMQTPFGKLFDPMADTGFHLTLFCGFIGSGWMPWWFLPIFYWRDLLSSILRTYIAAEDKEAMPARPSGKYKTASQGTAQIGTVALYWFVPLSAWSEFFPLYYACISLMACSLIITAISAVDYGYHAYIVSLKKRIAPDSSNASPA
ncbi:MAG: CDP-alcohol phosphatidyltransferase family protein, partial [Candidatus Methylomirabilota bacterium]